MYHHYGGRDPVPILPEWLTSYIRVSKELRANADLPKKCIHVGQTDVCLNAMAMWKLVADLLQFWTDLSGPTLYGGIFHYPSMLVERLMVDINPGVDIVHCITWERIDNNTYDWLNARALFASPQQAEFKEQQKCHSTLNDLEKATKELCDCSLAAEALENERHAKAETNSQQLLP